MNTKICDKNDIIINYMLINYKMILINNQMNK